MTESTSAFDFETALSELSQIVEQMEKGHLKLDESLTLFERGVGLSRECQLALQQAEQQVQILIEKSVDAQLAPYQSDAEDTPS